LSKFRIKSSQNAKVDKRFWSKLINSQDDGFVTLAELKNFDYVLHAIRDSSNPSVWLSRLVFEVYKDTVTNTLKKEQIQRIREGEFEKIGEYMIDNETKFLQQLDEGLKKLKKQFTDGTSLDAFTFMRSVLPQESDVTENVVTPSSTVRLNTSVFPDGGVPVYRCATEPITNTNE
jgi:hypothetical protein